MPVKQAARKMDKLVEYIQYDVENIKEIASWIGKPYERVSINNPARMFQLGQKFQDYIEVCVGKTPLVFGDVIVKTDGQFYIWKPEVFFDKFETIDDSKNGEDHG